MKHLFELQQPLVGIQSAQALEIRRHEGLPARVDLFARHAVLGGLQAVRRFEIAEQQAIVAHEQRVVMPAIAPERFEHLRPYSLVMRLVFGNLVLPHFEEKANSPHIFILHSASSGAITLQRSLCYLTASTHAL